MMTSEEAKKFANSWLPAWTGNDPEKLASFYSEDVFYSDPAIPKGVTGKEALVQYFRKLLAKNPLWRWEQVEGIPMAEGFLNKWRAYIPIGEKEIQCIGVCLVQLNEDGLIKRNEVYFDRSPWLAEFSSFAKNKS